MKMIYSFINDSDTYIKLSWIKRDIVILPHRSIEIVLTTSDENDWFEFVLYPEDNISNGKTFRFPCAFGKVMTDINGTYRSIARFIVDTNNDVVMQKQIKFIRESP